MGGRGGREGKGREGRRFAIILVLLRKVAYTYNTSQYEISVLVPYYKK